MKLQFALEYRTDWGQDVRVLFKIGRRKGAPVCQIFALDTTDGVHWMGEATVQERDAVDFEYRYGVYVGDELVRQEWNGVRRCFPWGGDRLFWMQDHWKDVPIMNHVYTDAYRRLSADVEVRGVEMMYFDSTLLMRVEAPQVGADECLALLGSLPQLGQWEPCRALMMSRGEGHEWFLALSAAGLQLPFEYKYVVMDSLGNVREWEGGENRRVDNTNDSGNREIGNSGTQESLVQEFQSSGIPSGCVTVVWDRPLRLDFSRWKVAGVRIYENENVDRLRAVVDWASGCGIKVLDLGSVADGRCMMALNESLMDWDDAPKVVDKVLESNDFKRFYDKNAWWLVPYAVYCQRREEEKENDYRLWHGLSRYDRKEVDAIVEQCPRQLMHYAYVQYMLDKALKAAAEYARSKGVVLECHVRVVAAECSVESWMASVVPNTEDARWWSGLMGRLSEFCDVVCLDGLESLAVDMPEIEEALPEGYDEMTKAEKEAYHKVWAEFRKRRESDQWAGEAQRRLPMIVEASGMLCCADDRTVENADAAAALDQMGILPTKVAGIADVKEALFGHLEWNPYRSVAMLDAADVADIPSWLTEVVVTRLMFCPSMLCVLPLDVWKKIDEEKIKELIERSGR